MPFPEAIKNEVRRRADYKCCRCHAIGPEVHHIVPQAEAGPRHVRQRRTPFPNCHDRFGDNPKKRKEIRGMRDHWYEIVEKGWHRAAEFPPPVGGMPQLSFGRAMIPTHSQAIVLFPPASRVEPRQLGLGRIIRVPVVNAQGSGDANRVHAQLTFLPDDRTGLYSPRHPAQGEWSSDPGTEGEIHLPGNGRMRLLDVIVVLDGQYPYAHEWTAASRAASLRGYAIKANQSRSIST